MALIKCKACGHMISKSAKSCPQCGHKNRHTSLFTWIVAGIFAYIFISAGFNLNNQDQKKEKATPPKPVVQKSSEDLRREKIERQFSGWSGSHYELTKLIKKSMNDPKSFEHVETKYIDAGDYLKVKTTFRGKNALGGVVKNWIWAKVDLDGNIIEIIEQGP